MRWKWKTRFRFGEAFGIARTSFKTFCLVLRWCTALGRVCVLSYLPRMNLHGTPYEGFPLLVVVRVVGQLALFVLLLTSVVVDRRRRVEVATYVRA